MSKKKQFTVDDDISQGLSDVINAVENNTGDFRYSVIALSRIETDPENPRKILLTVDDIRNGLSKNDPDYEQKKDEQEQLFSLAQTIKDNGLINPVVVYKHLDKYRLIAGERRFLAALLAGKNDIHARILDDKPNVLKLRLLQWIENKERQDLSLYERLQNIQVIMEAYKKIKQVDHVTAEKLGQLSGLSISQCNQYLIMMKAQTELLDAIKNKQINSIDKAAVVAGIKDPLVRSNILRACLNGAPLQLLKNLVKAEENKLKNQSNLILRKKTRGTANFALGKAKNAKVAKRIIDLIIEHPNYSKYADQFKYQVTDDNATVALLFKKLLAILEGELKDE